MDRLPCELTCMIINFLSLIQIIRARLVSKKWKKIIDNEIRIKELSLIDPDYFWKVASFPQPSYNDFDLKFCLKYRLSNNPLALISQKPMFNLLEYLNIQYVKDIKLLDYFKQLKKLKIMHLNVSSNEVLSLKNLESLSIHGFSNGMRSRPIIAKLTLDTIKLHKLLIRCNLDRFEFKHPNSIEVLDACLLNSDSTNIYIFPKLKVLNYYNDYRQLEPVRFDLSKLTELQIINIIKRSAGTIGAYSKPYISYNERDYLNDLIKQKNLLRRKDLSISFDGIRIEGNRLNSQDFKGDSFLLSSKYYPLLVNDLFWIHRINYTGIRFLQDENLTIDSLSKFTNIHSIFVQQKILNPHDFISYISNYPNLRSLILIRTKIRQEFINRLPVLCPFLTYFSITNSTRLNLNFLTEFEFLAILIVDHQLKLEIVLRLIKKLHLLYQIEFRFGVNQFDLKKYCGNYILSTKNYRITYRNSNLSLKTPKIYCDKFLDMNSLLDIFKMLDPNLNDFVDLHETPKKTRKRRSSSPLNDCLKSFKSN